jgi:hypothetical protein
MPDMIRFKIEITRLPNIMEYTAPAKAKREAICSIALYDIKTMKILFGFNINGGKPSF